MDLQLAMSQRFGLEARVGDDLVERIACRRGGRRARPELVVGGGEHFAVHALDDRGGPVSDAGGCCLVSVGWRGDSPARPIVVSALASRARAARSGRRSSAITSIGPPAPAGPSRRVIQVMRVPGASRASRRQGDGIGRGRIAAADEQRVLAGEVLPVLAQDVGQPRVDQVAAGDFAERGNPAVAEIIRSVGKNARSSRARRRPVRCRSCPVGIANEQAKRPVAPVLVPRHVPLEQFFLADRDDSVCLWK